MPVFCQGTSFLCLTFPPAAASASVVQLDGPTGKRKFGWEQGGGFPPLHGLLPSLWALSTHSCVLNAKCAQLLKMQEMSLLLQKENEPEQKKNQQAFGFSACAWQRVGEGLPPQGGRAPVGA